MIWLLIFLVIEINSIIAELFIRETKLNLSLVLKNIRLNPTQCFVMKIPNKRELTQITLNHSSDIDFKDFINLYKKCTPKSYSFFSY